MIIQIYAYYNLEDDLAIAKLGADHIGISCTGRRYIPSRIEKEFLIGATIENVSKIFKRISKPTKRVLLPLSHDLNEVFVMVERIEPDIVHIPFYESLQQLKTLRSKLGDIPIMQAIYVGPKGMLGNGEVITQAKECEEYIDYFLIDTKTTNAAGITGVTHDWTISQQIVKSVSKPVILAGGLSSANVISAIETVSPWGVDACTQLDEHPGKKDLNKVKRFIDTVREWEKETRKDR